MLKLAHQVASGDIENHSLGRRFAFYTITGSRFTKHTFAIRPDDKPNIATTKNGDQAIWYGDVVEIELATDAHSYYQLAISPSGALVPAKEVFNAVKRGMVQMGTISPAYVRDQIQVAGIAAGLPFAFKNVWEAAYFHKWVGFEKMIQEEAAEHGVFYSTDKVYPTELVLKKPVASLAEA